MSVRTEIKGNKYGKRTALGEFYLRPLPCGRKRCYELCQCECGTVQYVRRELLFHGKSRCCKKCMFKSEEYRKKLSDASKGKNKTHGMSKTAFYKKYWSIINRCNNANSKAYKDYGARGIKCLWKSFDEFYNDMYESYLKHCEKFGEKQTSIDRLDNSKNYNKENCRWATWKEQNNNQSKSVKYNWHGMELGLSQIYDLAKPVVSRTVYYTRVRQNGWDIDKALTTPKKVLY